METFVQQLPSETLGRLYEGLWKVLACFGEGAQLRTPVMLPDYEKLLTELFDAVEAELVVRAPIITTPERQNELNPQQLADNWG